MTWWPKSSENTREGSLPWCHSYPGPQEAVNELKRVVLDLGFKGILLKGHTGGVYFGQAREP
jgi:predicted TIM-barrel fold metal-dependent hydrolase